MGRSASVKEKRRFNFLPPVSQSTTHHGRKQNREMNSPFQTGLKEKGIFTMFSNIFYFSKKIFEFEFRVLFSPDVLLECLPELLPLLLDLGSHGGVQPVEMKMLNERKKISWLVSLSLTGGGRI